MSDYIALVNLEVPATPVPAASAELGLAPGWLGRTLERLSLIHI